MICDCCRRDVDYVRASFWHGDARICRECFAKWHDPDDDQLESSDTLSVGNYVRLRHGLPPIAATLAVLALSLTSTALASRRCLDQAEAARTWPTRTLAKDGDGCWTYDRRKPHAAEVQPTKSEMIAISAPAMIMPAAPEPEPKLIERWPETDLAQFELSEPEAENSSEAETALGGRHLALFVSLVLAVTSVIEVATGRLASSSRINGRTDRRTYWASRS